MFHCRAAGGSLAAHPLECADVGWFVEDCLALALAGAGFWRPMAFGALRGEEVDTYFDLAPGRGAPGGSGGVPNTVP